MTGHDDPAVDRPARILIVDDEPFNVDYLEQELECHGFVTKSAANGLEALERVAAAPPDLVLLDVMMPELDGISVLRMLKQDPETRLIPVVLMTALSAVEDRVRGIEAGADDFLTKPIDDRELLARIRTALRAKRAIDETVVELRSASDHLERYGRQEREVSVLVIDWRLPDPTVPDQVVGFVGRRYRAAAEERVRALGGLPAEGEGSGLLAVFEGSDAPSRAIAAVGAAWGVVAAGWSEPDLETGTLVVSAAVSMGPVQVGSTRVSGAGEPRWVFGAEGESVERASDLVRRAREAGIVVDSDVAALVRQRFALEPEGTGAYRVLAPLGPCEDPASETAERRIATILVTDIVGSTRTAERLGDRAWTELLAAHEQATREELAVFGGEEIDTTGDGFMLSFDRPARGIECAFAVRDRLAVLGLTIRAGLHTGEVEQVAGRPRGIALHVATRIAARANPGEVLVSATTRELAAGAELIFADRGEHSLSGVAEPRRLHAALSRSGERAIRAAEQPSSSQASGQPPIPSTGVTGYPAGLTAREVEVLRLAAVGLSDAEVADQLVLSVRTVNGHLRSVYRKLGVRSRAAAGRFAEENGLL